MVVPQPLAQAFELGLGGRHPFRPNRVQESQLVIQVLHPLPPFVKMLRPSGFLSQAMTLLPSAIAAPNSGPKGGPTGPFEPDGGQPPGERLQETTDAPVRLRARHFALLLAAIRGQDASDLAKRARSKLLLEVANQMGQGVNFHMRIACSSQAPCRLPEPVRAPAVIGSRHCRAHQAQEGSQLLDFLANLVDGFKPTTTPNLPKRLSGSAPSQTSKGLAHGFPPLEFECHTLLFYICSSVPSQAACNSSHHRLKDCGLHPGRWPWQSSRGFLMRAFVLC
jgi:hypothetical protein